VSVLEVGVELGDLRLPAEELVPPRLTDHAPGGGDGHYGRGDPDRSPEQPGVLPPPLPEPLGERLAGVLQWLVVELVLEILV
jgi:hypothetical protein